MTRNMVRFVSMVPGLIAVCVLPAVSGAFEIMPEYRGISSGEEWALDEPMYIDAEYSSDFLTYQLPFDWEYDWIVSTQAFQFSSGSLAPRRFQIDSRLKVDQEVLPGLRIRFIHFLSDDLEDSITRNVLEMQYFPSPSWGMALYGEPSRYKKEDNAGFAFILRPSDGHELRMFATVMEMDHAKHEGGGAYSPDGSAFPMNVGITGRWHSNPASGSRDYVTYSARWETPSDRTILSEYREHEYERLTATAAFQKGIGSGRVLAGEVACDDKREESRIYRREGVEDRQWIRARVLSRFQCVFPIGGRELVPAFAYQYRYWNSPDKDIVFRDYQPQLWCRFGEFGAPSFRQRWSLGYEMTCRVGTDTSDLYDEDAPETPKNEHRFNARYDMRFGSRGTMSLVFTFDADRFGGGEPWEGGNGQLSLVF
jgi:hypothetical protein